MRKKGILAAANEDFTMPAGARTKHYTSRSIPLTTKQKRRRKLNKIGRKSRKLNFKTR